MRAIYIVALYSGIECHTEFQGNLGAFPTKEAADAFVATEEPKLKHQIGLAEKHTAHMDEWDKVHVSPPYHINGPGLEAYGEHTALREAECERYANEIGLNLEDAYRLGSYVQLEITEVLFYDEPL